jgi:hypothetical protein
MVAFVMDCMFISILKELGRHIVGVFKQHCYVGSTLSYWARFLRSVNSPIKPVLPDWHKLYMYFYHCRYIRHILFSKACSGGLDFEFSSQAKVAFWSYYLSDIVYISMIWGL